MDLLSRFLVIRGETVLSPPAESAETVTPQPSLGLWVICVLVGSAVLLMWAAGRVKPLVIYPLLIGGVLGVWSRIASAFCHMPRYRWWVLLPICCAMVVAIGGLALASQRRAADIKPANPLAEQMLRQFEQQEQVDPIAPRVAPPFWSYLQERYHNANSLLMGMWLVAELLVAVITCLAAMKSSWPTKNSVISNQAH